MDPGLKTFDRTESGNYNTDREKTEQEETGFESHSDRR